MKLDPHQERAVQWLVKRRRGLVQSPAGSGKTIIAAAALDRVLHSKPRPRPARIGWLCDTREQAQQAWNALRLFPDLVQQDITVACAAAGTDWSECDVLVVDEAHHARAEGWSRQVASCPGARWAFTATPPDRKDRPMEADTLALLFGGEHLVVERTEVTNRLVEAEVFMVDATDPGVAPRIDAAANEMISRMRRFWQGSQGELQAIAKWQAVNKYGIKANRRRNLAAVTVALAESSAGRPTLLLANHLEHCDALQAQIPGSAVCHGKLPKAARRYLLEQFRNRELACLLATSLADEGLDLPEAEVLVLASGGKSKAKAEQRTGRVLRTSEGKELATVWDFQDLCHPLMTKHASSRVDLYGRLGYAVRYLGWQDLTERFPLLTHAQPEPSVSQ